MQPTSLRSWVSGRDFGKLVVLQAVAVGRSRSAADAHVGRLFSFLWFWSLKIEKFALGARKNLACEVFTCCENLYIFSRFCVSCYLIMKRPKLAAFAKFRLRQKSHIRLHVEGAKLVFFDESNCLK